MQRFYQEALKTARVAILPGLLLRKTFQIGVKIPSKRQGYSHYIFILFWHLAITDTFYLHPQDAACEIHHQVSGKQRQYLGFR